MTFHVGGRKVLRAARRSGSKLVRVRSADGAPNGGGGSGARRRAAREIAGSPGLEGVARRRLVEGDEVLNVLAITGEEEKICPEDGGTARSFFVIEEMGGIAPEDLAGVSGDESGE